MFSVQIRCSVLKSEVVQRAPHKREGCTARELRLTAESPEITPSHTIRIHPTDNNQAADSTQQIPMLPYNRTLSLHSSS